MERIIIGGKCSRSGKESEGGTKKRREWKGTRKRWREEKSRLYSLPDMHAVNNTVASDIDKYRMRNARKLFTHTFLLLLHATVRIFIHAFPCNPLSRVFFLISYSNSMSHWYNFLMAGLLQINICTLIYIKLQVSPFLANKFFYVGRNKTRLDKFCDVSSRFFNFCKINFAHLWRVTFFLLLKANTYLLQLKSRKTKILFFKFKFVLCWKSVRMFTPKENWKLSKN